MAQRETLTARKTAIQLRIAQRRAELAGEFRALSGSFNGIDGWLARLSRLRHLLPAATSLVSGATHLVAARKARGVRSVLRWAPAAWRLASKASELLRR